MLVISKIKHYINIISELGSLETANTNPKKAFFGLLIPTFFAIFCLSLNGFIDSIFVSECGHLSLIAVGVIQSIFLLVTALGTGLSVAANSYLSYNFGKNRSEEHIRKVVSNIIITTFIFGVITSIILCLFLNPILQVLDLHGAFSYSLVYGYVIFAGNIFFFTSAVLPGVLKAGGDIVKSSVSLVFTSLLNVILDYILIHLLNWGVFGAGCATTVCSAICTVLLIYFVFKNKEIHFTLRDFSLYDSEQITKIIHYAIPVALENATLSAYAFILNMIFNIFTSTVDFAIFVAFFNILKFVIIPTVAISEANVTLSSYLYGASNFKAIRSMIKYEIMLGVFIAAIIWIALFVFNNDLALIYSQSHSKVFLRNFVKVLPVYAISLIFMPFGNIGVSVLQSLQKYKMSFMVSLIKSIFLEVILALVFALIIGNIWGIYIGLVLGCAIGAILALIIALKMLNKAETEAGAEATGV